MICGILLCILIVTTLLIMIVCVYNGVITVSKGDETGVVIFFAVMILGEFVSTMICMPRWSEYVEMNSDGIVFSSFMGSKVICDYKSFSYMYFVLCRYRNVQNDYVVISKTKMPCYKLQHIEDIVSSKNLIKFKCNEEMLILLKEFMPDLYHKRTIIEST